MPISDELSFELEHRLAIERKRYTLIITALLTAVVSLVTLFAYNFASSERQTESLMRFEMVAKDAALLDDRQEELAARLQSIENAVARQESSLRSLDKLVDSQSELLKALVQREPAP